MQKQIILLLSFLFLISTDLFSQNTMRLAFYNCENLLDTIDNPETRDDEFTPSGMKRWNTHRFYHKIKQLSKVIMSLGEWDGLGVLGLAEIENRKVVEDLLRYSPLKKANYKVVHFDSPDRRGIDVALLYNPKIFTLVEAKPLQVDLPGGRTTRDILYVKGLVNKKDTLRVLVNHWPSRWGGQVNSEPRRIFVANFLKQWIDDNIAPDDNLVIVGDLNDGPHDTSVIEALGAKSKSSDAQLINMMLNEEGEKKLGTHAYNGVWEALDQIIVSQPLLQTTNNLQIADKLAHVYKTNFMLIQKDGVEQVFRSFRGARYEGGFSDHLPVYIDISYNK